MDDESNVFLRATGNAPVRYSRLALSSFVCGALSIAGLVLSQVVGAFVYLVLLFAPAIVTGHLAHRQFRRAPGQFRNESMAQFGLWVGYLVMLLNGFALGAMIWLASR
jgi:hypothetical protein